MTLRVKDTTFRGVAPLNLRSKSGSRFSLKKRPASKSSSTRDMVNLSSYNSAFLTGLFADVAQANVLDEFGLNGATQKRGSELISPDDNDTVQEDFPSTKRIRVSCISPVSTKPSRARRSYLNLSELNSSDSGEPFATATPVSPRSITHAFENQATISDAATASDSSSLSSHHGSLAYQLNCVDIGEVDATVGEDASTEPPSKTTKTIMDAGKLVFPHLPATVSDSSCNTGLTRAKLDRQMSATETDSTKGESFGWFVDLDGDTPAPSTDVQAYETAKSPDDLAFQAPTAPVRANDTAELEWAQAADTVDDVLGDFF
jgi:hypothetical protein